MEANGTTFIGRPVDTVYAYVIDVSNDANWRTDLDESGYREGEAATVGAIGFSRAGDVEVNWQIEKIVPGELVVWKLLNGPVLGTGGYRLAPVEGGTEFTLLGDVKPTGFYRLLGPLFAWMGRRRNQADVEKLKAILESTGE